MGDHPATPDLSAFGTGLEWARTMWDGDPASHKLGITALEVELRDNPHDPDAPPLGRARARMTIDDRMVNGHDICHGGYMFTLADSAFALACNASGRPTVASGCDIDYLEPVKLGDVLVAEATERIVRGRSGITDVTLTRESDGRVVAEFRGRSRTLPAPRS
ncbi:hydroxyphenylacetyl-CoA thioesterase PaaI [Mobilicoccus caccae]|uniref:Phenylacetic acid degradation protein PaaD n=1 Tax=Mobilicoccus caccae TaxID=1859295 RepID=A0ABQ6INY4_9MICO|nr:hydroxyphenylacetyl-CoA thioesterase PaaI [Mobilicoccus caccae]GMA39169.1 phenylacetic acid degradation protein PaaD [Mobilicoccus caccae]